MQDKDTESETKTDSETAPVFQRFQGSYGEYYSYNDIDYDIHFPVDWIFNKPAVPFGPEDCEHCSYYGYYHGVFIGYCVNCAKECGYTRGNGMIGHGKEVVTKDIYRLNALDYFYLDPSQIKPENSMWNVYMQTASPEKIGDAYLQREHQIYYEEIPDIVME
jgi:hypothetical protein